MSKLHNSDTGLNVHMGQHGTAKVLIGEAAPHVPREYDLPTEHLVEENVSLHCLRDNIVRYFSGRKAMLTDEEYARLVYSESVVYVDVDQGRATFHANQNRADNCLSLYAELPIMPELKTLGLPFGTKTFTPKDLAPLMRKAVRLIPDHAKRQALFIQIAKSEAKLQGVVTQSNAKDGSVIDKHEWLVKSKDIPSNIDMVVTLPNGDRKSFEITLDFEPNGSSGLTISLFSGELASAIEETNRKLMDRFIEELIDLPVEYRPRIVYINATTSSLES